MKETQISKGGQLSIPAAVRHRWGTRRVVIEDQGNVVLIRPIPADPIGAAVGSLAGRGPSSRETRTRVRREEAEADARKRRRP